MPTAAEISDYYYQATGVRFDPDYYKLMLEDWWFLNQPTHRVDWVNLITPEAS